MYKILISDKLSDEGIAIFKADKDIEVDIKLGKVIFRHQSLS